MRGKSSFAPRRSFSDSVRVVRTVVVIGQRGDEIRRNKIHRNYDSYQLLTPVLLFLLGVQSDA